LKKHPIIFVGAGPGDPELITVKGKRAIEEADIVVYAGSLVAPEMLKWANPRAQKYDSSGMTLEETHRVLAQGYHNGHRVVRLHSGDPSLYGAIYEQMVKLAADDIPYEVVPGVSAVFAAAAKLKRELTVPEVSQTLIITRKAGRTPVPERESLASLAAHRTTIALYLSVANIDEVVNDLLTAYSPDTPVVVAYRVSWPDEQFVFGTLENIAQEVKKLGIRRQALILTGPAFSDTSKEKRSKLYDKKFSHGFRKSDLHL